MVNVDVLVVFGIVLGTFTLFVTERFPVDVTAILVMVTLIVLGEWTHISPEEGISGFSSPATITVLAMLILSAGVSRTGLVQLVGRRMASFAGDDLGRQLLATIGVAGPVSGFVNNTPVVAVLVPVISDVAHQGRTSPSKLLIPLSFASMLGGMLTLIGTSTSILASATAFRLAAQYPDRYPGLTGFEMFTFTPLGLIVFVVGGTYLLFIGHYLIPERVPPEEDYIQEYEIEEYLTEVTVGVDASIVGQTVAQAFRHEDFDVDILGILRDDALRLEGLHGLIIRPDDVLRIRADRDTLSAVMERDALTLTGDPRSEADLETDSQDEQTVVEVVIPRGSHLVGESLVSSTFRQRYDATVLAFRSRGETIRAGLDERPIRVGDTLLLQASPDSIDRLARNEDFIVAHVPDTPEYRTEKIPTALAIIGGVVALPALDILPILVSALAGVVAMVLAGVINPNELYDSVEWNVIFLLAGVIPLGMALEQTGGADLLGSVAASSSNLLPTVAVLWLFYIVTALVTEMVSNNASVVLMIPVAVEAAVQIGANPFAFLIVVTFAASMSFLGPIGYQTNLFVYGPGGYRFTDYARVGAPLQLLISLVVVGGITVFWGVAA